MRDNARECTCLRCWNRNHPGDPNWPVQPMGATTQGTVEVQIPCEIVFELDSGRPKNRIVVTSACRFFGHTVAEARARAIRHLRLGAEACTTARAHTPRLYWPPLDRAPGIQEPV